MTLHEPESGPSSGDATKGASGMITLTEVAAQKVR